MIINKNSYDDIVVSKNQKLAQIAIFSGGKGKKNIKIEEGGCLKYLFICSEETELDVDIETLGDKASISVNGIFLAKNGSNIYTKVQIHLGHHQGVAKIHLVSFLQDGSTCDVNGNIVIKQGTSGCDGELLEENILLGKKIKIKTLPMLDVRSNDVVASHGARIEKLDPQKLFYMQAKGISANESKKLLITGYFEVLFSLISRDVCKDCTESGCEIKSEEESIENLKIKWLEYLLD